MSDSVGVTGKETIERCQDCNSYRKPKCKITKNFTSRKNSCKAFKKK
jgi:hypothetical protein